MKKVKVPSWIGNKIKEIQDQLPPGDPRIWQVKYIIEQQNKIHKALKKHKDPEDQKLLKEVYDLFESVLRKAEKFMDKKRTVIAYTRALAKLAKYPESKRKRYKELIGFKDGC